MASGVERPGSPLPMLLLVGLAILGALWIVRVVTGLLWTLVQLGVLAIIIAAVVSVMVGRGSSRQRDT